MFIPLAFIFTAALFWGRGPRPAPPRPPTTEEMGDTEDDDWERLVDTYHSLSEKISVHFGYIPSREGVKLAMEQREALELFKKLPYDLQELIRASLAPKSRVNQSQVFSMWIRPNDNTEEVRVMVRVNEEGFTLTTCDGEATAAPGITAVDTAVLPEIATLAAGKAATAGKSARRRSNSSACRTRTWSSPASPSRTSRCETG